MTSAAVELLAVSGSLRSGSSNTELLKAVSLLAPARFQVTWFTGLAELPHFNPDLDGPELPPEAAQWRKQVGTARGILLSSPEYAHGVPGTLKNALDWLVGGIEILDQPVALLNPSPHSRYAHASLVEILTTMGAHVVPDASVVVPLSSRSQRAEEITRDPALVPIIRSALAALEAAIDIRGERPERES
jgi:NAD(P)H-dependent FMN reductase